MEITRIVFESYSGYGMITEAYEEKLVLRPGSISFEHRPKVLEYGEIPIPDWNQPAKWSYKANSSKFTELFSSLASWLTHMPELLERACDAGGLTIKVIFEDKSRKELQTFEGSPSVESIMKALSAAIPPLEQMPQMLEVYTEEEDCEEEM